MTYRRVRNLAMIVVLMAVSTPALAETATDAPHFDALGVSPTSRRLDVHAGATVEQAISVINDGETTIKYHLRATDYQVHDGDYHPSFNSATDPARTTAGWFKINTADATLAPHDQATLKFNVQVPASAVVGGHYGVVFAETVPPPPPPGGSNIARVKRIGAVFYITVAGDLHRAGVFALSPIPFWFQHPPVIAHFSVRGTGNTHFDVSGRLALDPPFGASPPPVDLRGIVLPGTRRDFEVQLPLARAIGLYQLSGSVDYLGEKHEVGPQWVLVAPLITVAVVSATLFIMLGLLIYLIVRRIKRRRRSARPPTAG